MISDIHSPFNMCFLKWERVKIIANVFGAQEHTMRMCVLYVSSWEEKNGEVISEWVRIVSID